MTIPRSTVTGARSSRSLVRLVASAVLISACGDGDVTGPEARLGTIVVSVRTLGVELDLDGYLLRVQGEEPQSVEHIGTVTFTDLRRGPTKLTLEGLTVTCDPEGGPTREVVVRNPRPVHLLFTVVCTPKPIVFSGWPVDSPQPHLYRMNVDGTGTRRLGAVVGNSPRWSPDGSKILFDDGSRLYVTDAEGSSEALVTLGEGIDGTWSPDGTRIAFTRYEPGIDDAWEGRARIRTIAPDGTGGQVLTGSLDDSYHADWGPDGRIAFIQWSEDGEQEGILRHSLAVMEPDGSVVTRWYSDELATDAWLSRPAWSPDGGRIALVVGWVNESAIFIGGEAGGNWRRRGGVGSLEGEPRWFGDGTTLLFTNYRAPDDSRSELRTGSYDSQASFPLSHFMSNDRGGDVRRPRPGDAVTGPPR